MKTQEYFKHPENVKYFKLVRLKSAQVKSTKYIVSDKIKVDRESCVCWTLAKK